MLPLVIQPISPSHHYIKDSRNGGRGDVKDVDRIEGGEEKRKGERMIIVANVEEGRIRMRREWVMWCRRRMTYFHNSCKARRIHCCCCCRFRICNFPINPVVQDCRRQVVEGTLGGRRALMIRAYDHRGGGRGGDGDWKRRGGFKGEREGWMG